MINSLYIYHIMSDTEAESSDKVIVGTDIPPSLELLR